MKEPPGSWPAFSQGDEGESSMLRMQQGHAGSVDPIMYLLASSTASGAPSSQSRQAPPRPTSCPGARL